MPILGTYNPNASAINLGSPSSSGSINLGRPSTTGIPLTSSAGATAPKPTTITPPVIKTPAAQTFIKNKTATTPPTVYNVNSSNPTDPSSSGNPLSYDGSSVPSTPPTTATNPPEAPQSATDQAFAAYIKSLEPNSDVTAAKTAYNDFTANENLGVTNLEGQGRGIPLTLIRGQQAKLKAQAEPEATRLQNAIGIAQDSATNISTAAKAKADYEQTKVTNANKTETINGQIVQKQPDGTYKSVFSAPKETTLPASAQEYEYAKSPAGGNYKGTFTQYQNEDANRKAKAGGSGADQSSAVAGWVANIKSGTAKLSDITGNPTLKNLVSTALASSGATGSQALLSTTQESLKELENLVTKNIGFTGAVGAKGITSLFGLKGSPLAGTAAANFDAKLKQVKNDVIIPNLNLLHGLGRVTDREFQALSSAITSLSPDLPEGDFKTELNNLITRIDKLATTANGSNTNSELSVTDPEGGVHTFTSKTQAEAFKKAAGIK